MAIKDYETAAANNDGSGKLFPEGILAAELNNSLREMQADLRLYANDADYFEFGDGSGEATINVLSGTQFRIVGSDQRSAYHVNRRVRAIGTGTGTIYGSITAVVFTAGNTDVTVVWDSGSLSVETVAIAIGNVSANQDSSFPRKIPGDFEVLGSITAANLVTPVRQLLVNNLTTRQAFNPVGAGQIHTFNFNKLSDASQIIVDVHISFQDNASSNKVTSANIKIGSFERRFTLPTPNIGNATFSTAVGRGHFTGLASGTQTVRIDFESAGQAMSYVINPNTLDSSLLVGGTRSIFTVTEF